MAAVPAKILTLLQAIQTIRYGNVSGISLISYDILLTFPREVELIWKRRWSIPTALYIAVRYLPLLQQIFVVYGMIGPADKPSDVSTAWIYYELWISTVQVTLTQTVLVYRLHAIYRKKKVLIFMILCLTSSFIAMAFIVSFAVGRTISVAEPIPGIHFCAADPNQHRSKLGIIWAYWIPIMVAEFIFFGLAAYQLYINIRAFGAEVLKPATGGLISIILRDAVWYFLCVIVIDIINLIINLADHALGEFPVGLTGSAFSIVATRLLLSLRELNAKRSGDTTLGGTTRREDPGIEFAIRKTVQSNATGERSEPAAWTMSTDGDSTLYQSTLATRREVSTMI